MLKLFQMFSEPFKSYFLCVSYYSPEKYLMPQAFEQIALKTIKNGPNMTAIIKDASRQSLIDNNSSQRLISNQKSTMPNSDTTTEQKKNGFI